MVTISARFDRDLLDQIDAYARRLQAECPPRTRVTRTAALVTLIQAGLAAAERQEAGRDGAET